MSLTFFPALSIKITTFQKTRNNCPKLRVIPRGIILSFCQGAKWSATIFFHFCHNIVTMPSFSESSVRFRNLRIIPSNSAKSRNNSNYAEILCDCNTENRRTVSHILAGIMQHAPGSRSNILPGSAPALHSVILYPFSPLPLPLLRHPITLTPDTGA